jgi:hypothetical protein
MCMPTVRRTNSTGRPSGYLTAVLAEYALQMSQGSIGVPFRIVVMNAGHGAGVDVSISLSSTLTRIQAYPHACLQENTKNLIL